MKFNLEQFAKNEIELGKSLLKLNPNDIKQKDRISYWALKLGDMKTARKYAVTPKMKGMVK